MSKSGFKVTFDMFHKDVLFLSGPRIHCMQFLNCYPKVIIICTVEAMSLSKKFKVCSVLGRENTFWFSAKNVACKLFPSPTTLSFPTKTFKINV